MPTINNKTHKVRLNLKRVRFLFHHIYMFYIVCMYVLCDLITLDTDRQTCLEFNAWSKRIGQNLYGLLFSEYVFNFCIHFQQRVDHTYIVYIFVCGIYYIYYYYRICLQFNYNYLNSNRAHRRKYKALSNLFILVCICVFIISPSLPFLAYPLLFPRF